jgi:lipopolysaccharide biosynthesis glycosyltransferase
MIINRVVSCSILAIFFTYVGFQNLQKSDHEYVFHFLDRLTHHRRSGTKFGSMYAPPEIENKSTRVGLCPSVFVSSRYAFVTYLGINPAVQSVVDLYVISACKLAQSLLQHSDGVDLILLLATEDATPLRKYQRDMIKWSGWQICEVTPISADDPINNRFHDAKIYTKLHAWQLVEYSAVASIDADMIALGNASALFHDTWEDMQRNNYEFGMGLDYPSPASKQSTLHYLIGRCVQSRSLFNAGLFLLKPSLETYHNLIQMVNMKNYDVVMCEQGLLNAYFHNRTYTIPFKYNANVVSKACAPQTYNQHQADIVFLHFTVAKPWMNTLWSTQWMWSCPWWGVEDECALWNSY